MTRADADRKVKGTEGEAGPTLLERSTCVDLESRTSSYRLSQDEGLLFSDVKWSREAKKKRIWAARATTRTPDPASS